MEESVIPWSSWLNKTPRRLRRYTCGFCNLVDFSTPDGRVVPLPAGTAGSPVEPKKTSEYAWPRLASQTDVLMFASKLEAGAASAYLGALRAIENKEYLTAAASIMGNETQHLALLRQVLKENPVPSPFIG